MRENHAFVRGSFNEYDLHDYNKLHLIRAGYFNVACLSLFCTALGRKNCRVCSKLDPLYIYLHLYLIMKIIASLILKVF